MKTTQDLHTFAEIQPAEMYHFPRTTEQAFGPHCGHVESELIDPPWTLKELLILLVIFGFAFGVFIGWLRS